MIFAEKIWLAHLAAADHAREMRDIPAHRRATIQALVVFAYINECELVGPCLLVS